MVNWGYEREAIMKIIINTREELTFNFDEGTYSTDGGCEKFVYTILIKKDGGAQCGPTVTRAQWALIEDIQAAIKKSGI
jgi:hypothetical protein